MARKTLDEIAARAGRLDWGSAAPIPDIAGDVAVTGVGESAFSGPSGRESVGMSLEAIARAIADAGLRPEDVEGLMYTPHVPGQVRVEDFHRHFGTSHPMWVSEAGGGMVWAATCFVHAAEALRSGKARHIVNVFGVDWASRRAAGIGTPGDWHANESMKALFELPYGYYPQPVYMATQATRHMHEYGTTPAQLGELAVAFRRHANGHPGAVMHRKTLTMEQYLSRPMLVEPLRVEDCCLISDGAAAWV
ncbi:MAG: hypothetical protein ACKPE6_16220, partial [Gammaproteobacteria bacterium]